VLGSLEIYKFKTYLIKPPESTKSKARNKILECSYMHMTMKPKIKHFSTHFKTILQKPDRTDNSHNTSKSSSTTSSSSSS
jgi:hypothetical protein